MTDRLPVKDNCVDSGPILVAATLSRLLFSYQTGYQWRSKGGKRGHAPRVAGLGGAPTHFCSHFKTPFKQKFRPKVPVCLKMRIFGKISKKSPQRRGLLPRTPFGLRLLGTPPPDPQLVILTQLTCYF